MPGYCEVLDYAEMRLLKKENISKLGENMVIYFRRFALCGDDLSNEVTKVCLSLGLEI